MKSFVNVSPSVYERSRIFYGKYKKGYLFDQKWCKRAKGLNLGAEPSRIRLCYCPPTPHPLPGIWMCMMMLITDLDGDLSGVQCHSPFLQPGYENFIYFIAFVRVYSFDVFCFVFYSKCTVKWFGFSMQLSVDCRQFCKNMPHLFKSRWMAG